MVSEYGEKSMISLLLIINKNVSLISEFNNDLKYSNTKIPALPSLCTLTELNHSLIIDPHRWKSFKNPQYNKLYKLEEKDKLQIYFRSISTKIVFQKTFYSD